MSRWGVVAALVGLALLSAVFYQTDLGEVARHLAHLSWWEAAVLVALYFTGRLGGVASWLMTTSLAPTPAWFVRLLRVHLIGGAVEHLTPLAGMGGEPVKMLVLKRDYAIGMRESGASLALTRMTDLAAIILFCAIGMVAASSLDGSENALRRPAYLAVAFLLSAAVAAFALQRMRVLARATPRLRERFGERGRAIVDAVVDVEARIYDAYSRRPGRLALSVAATFFEWTLEATLVWVCLGFLDVPVTIAAAVSIAAFALAVRTAFFFVPADIGTQEAALVAICEALVGTGGVGLAIAAVVRLGEAVWTIVGIAVGLPYLRGDRGMAGETD